MSVYFRMIDTLVERDRITLPPPYSERTQVSGRGMQKYKVAPVSLLTCYCQLLHLEVVIHPFGVT